MGEIIVEGIGKFKIKGDTPDAEETSAIMEMMGVQKTPTIPVSDPTPAERLTGARPPDTLTPNPNTMLQDVTGVPRSTAAGVGATVGGALGEVAGPIGIAGGAAGGGAAGSLAYDAADAALRWSKGAAQPDEGPLAPIERALKGGEEEFLWTGGATALIPAFRAIKPFVLGAHTPNARRLQKVSEQMGIPLGATSVSDRPWVKGAGKVIGVFPFIGTPAKYAGVKTEVALRNKYNKILNELAPNATLADVGVDLTEGAVARFGKFKAAAGELYDDFFKKASALPVPDIFPTDKAVALGIKLTGKAKAGDIVLRSGDALRPPLPKVLEKYIEDLTDLPSHVTAEQYRQLQLDLGEVISSLKTEGYDISKAVKMKKALEQGFNSPDVSRLDPETGQAVVNSLTTANEFYARNITQFKSPTAKRFGRVDKAMFGAGAFKPGTIYEDQVFNVVFNSKSPQALADLRGLVGPSRFSAASRKFIETSFDKIIDPKSGHFNAARFGKAIGLGSDSGEQALAEILKGSTVKMETLKNFVELASRSERVSLPDTAAFIARRMTLGGWRAGLGALTMGGPISANPAMGILGIFAVRHGAGVISSPKKLKAMIKILEPTTTDHQRRALLVRFGRQLFEEEEAARERHESRMEQPRGRLSAGAQ